MLCSLRSSQVGSGQGSVATGDIGEAFAEIVEIRSVCVGASAVRPSGLGAVYKVW